MEERIANEVERLLGMFKDTPPEKMVVMKNLIERVAFMQITLEDMEADIKANGTIEVSKTLPRKRRERPIVKSYNAMIKNYNSTLKQLFDKTPDAKASESDDELLKFLQRGS
ncbi:MAG: hypothetical protein P4L59_16345 [Desulfosporosinus sp.]|nr:hypothetical protein [Desulfosporosinus sp.]